MYSEQLEQLIKSVLADGVITEKERAVVHKKAEAEGVDLDDIDVYLDGLLVQQTQKALEEERQGHWLVQYDMNELVPVSKRSTKVSEKSDMAKS